MTNHLNIKSDADHLDLRLLLQSLIDKKWWIGLCSLVVLILAMIYIAFKPIRYHTSILLQVQQKQLNTLGTATKSNQLFDPANIPEEPIAVQIALIRSKFILDPVIQSLGLDIQVYSNDNSFFNKKLTDEIKLSELEVPNRYLKTKLRLVIDKPNHFSLYNSKNKLLIAGIVGERVADPSFAINVNDNKAPVGRQYTVIKIPASEVMTQLLTKLTITDLSGSNETNSNKIGILQMSLTGENPNLITTILNQIATVTQQKSIQRTSMKAEKTLNFLDQQLPMLRHSLEEAEAKFNRYRSTSGKMDIKFQTPYLMSNLTNVDKQLQQMRLEKLNMLEEYTSNHPFVISLSQKINAAQKQRSELLSQLEKLPEADQIAVSLNREVNVRKNLYMNLLNQIHELQVIKAGIVSDIHILVLASKPDSPILVKKSIIGIASLLIGLIIGSIAVLSWRLFV